MSRVTAAGRRLAAPRALGRRLDAMRDGIADQLDQGAAHHVQHARLEPNCGAAGRGKVHLLAVRLRDIARGAFQRRDNRRRRRQPQLRRRVQRLRDLTLRLVQRMGVRDRAAQRAQLPSGLGDRLVEDVELRIVGAAQVGRLLDSGRSRRRRLRPTERRDPRGERVHPPQQRIDLRLRRGTGPIAQRQQCFFDGVAPSAISRSLTTRAAPLSVCARRSSRWTSAGAGSALLEAQHARGNWSSELARLEPEISDGSFAFMAMRPCGG